MDQFQTSPPEIKNCHTFGEYLVNQSPIMFSFFQNGCFWRWWIEDFQRVLVLISTSAVRRLKICAMVTSSLKILLGGIVLQDLFTTELSWVGKFEISLTRNEACFFQLCRPFLPSGYPRKRLRKALVSRSSRNWQNFQSLNLYFAVTFRVAHAKWRMWTLNASKLGNI